MVRRSGQGLADSRKDLLIRREKDKALFRDDSVGDADGEFAKVAFNQFGFDFEFALQQGRHPGGARLVSCSGFAVSDSDGVHGKRAVNQCPQPVVRGFGASPG